MWSRIPCTHGPLKKTVPPCYHAGIILLPSCWYYNDLMSPHVVVQIMQLCLCMWVLFVMVDTNAIKHWAQIRCEKCKVAGIHPYAGLKLSVCSNWSSITGSSKNLVVLNTIYASFLVFWKLGVQEKCHVLNHVHSCLQPIPTEPPPHECRLARTDWHTGMAIRYILRCTKGGDWFLHKAPK